MAGGSFPLSVATFDCIQQRLFSLSSLCSIIFCRTNTNNQMHAAAVFRSKVKVKYYPARPRATFSHIHTHMSKDPARPPSRTYTQRRTQGRWIKVRIRSVGGGGSKNAFLWHSLMCYLVAAPVATEMTTAHFAYRLQPKTNMQEEELEVEPGLEKYAEMSHVGNRQRQRGVGVVHAQWLPFGNCQKPQRTERQVPLRGQLVFRERGGHGTVRNPDRHRVTTMERLNAPTCIMRQISLFISRAGRELLKWRFTGKVGASVPPSPATSPRPETPKLPCHWPAVNAQRFTAITC